MKRRCFKNTIASRYERKNDAVLHETIVTLWQTKLKYAILPRDCMYNGKAGELYWLTMMVTRFPAQLPGLELKADFIYQQLSQKIQAFSSPNKSHDTSLLCGFAGEVLATWYYLHKTQNHHHQEPPTRIQIMRESCVEMYSKLCVHSAAASHSVNEILYGRAGLLMGCTLLAQAGVDTGACQRQLLLRILKDGRMAAASTTGGGLPDSQDSPPLVYSWHGKYYLGAAHGYAGILSAIFTHWSDVPQEFHHEIRCTLDWMVSFITNTANAKNSNVPSSVSDSFQVRPGKDHLVHWCHGAPGIVPTLCLAAQVFDEPAYLNTARILGETIWKYGLLHKGWGLCHGAPGNGYSFLTLYRATNDRRYRQYAQGFAMWLCGSPEAKSIMETPDEPLGLYTGIYGGTLYLLDILTGDDDDDDDDVNDCNFNDSLPFLAYRPSVVGNSRP